MHHYYFVASSLPSLVLEEPLEISFEQLMYLLRPNLNRKDLEKVAVLQRLIDIYNIRALYAKKPFDTRGTLNEKELDEALLVQADLPEYVFDFLEQFEESKEKVRHFFGLLSRYFTYEGLNQKGFLKELLKVQKEIRLVLTAMRAKKMQKDILEELQFEDFTDPFIAQILAQKDQENYEPPLEYLDLKQALSACGEDPWQQYKTVLVYEFQKIEEMICYPLFSMDWILGYIARFMLVEKHRQLNAERGGEMIHKMKTR